MTNCGSGGTVVWRGKPFPQGKEHRLHAVREVEFPQNVVDMSAHGRLAHPQLAGDGPIAQAFGQQLQHCGFPLRKMLDPRQSGGMRDVHRVAHFIKGPAGNGQGQPRLAAVQGTDGPRQVQGVGVLQKTARGAGTNGGKYLVLGRKARQDKDAGVWPRGDHPLNGFDPQIPGSTGSIRITSGFRAWVILTAW